jgi:hypothetical protein
MHAHPEPATFREHLMTRFEILVGGGLLALLAFQILITWRVWQSRIYDREQKLLQSKLIWLVPLVGAMLVMSVMQEDDASERRGGTDQRS